MSQQITIDAIQTHNNTKFDLIDYSSRLVERTIERALDIIYEQSNDIDPKIYEWRHSTDKIPVTNA